MQSSLEGQQRSPRGARVVAWGLVAAWTAAIFAASSIPRGSSIPMPSAGWDKLAHAGVFAVFGGLVALALRAEGLRARRAALLGGLLGLAYGGLDELHQAWTPGRAMDLEDVLADGLGAVGGALVASGRPAERTLGLWPGAPTTRMTRTAPATPEPEATVQATNGRGDG